MPPYASTSRALNPIPSRPALPQEAPLPDPVDLPSNAAAPRQPRKSHERSPPINRTSTAVAAVDNWAAAMPIESERDESFRTDLPKTGNLDLFLAQNAEEFASHTL